jgi:hypothetical protein
MNGDDSDPGTTVDAEGSEATGGDRRPAPGADERSADPDEAVGESVVPDVEAGPVAPDEVRRLDPRVRLVWFARAALVSFVLGAVMMAVERLVVPVSPLVGPAVFALLFLIGTTLAVLRYRAWCYRLRPDSLYLERGVLTQVRTVVPYVRVQHVDTRRGPVERATGLATVVVYTAGSRGADVTIPGLTPHRAEELQSRLKRLAIVAEGEDAV